MRITIKTKCLLFLYDCRRVGFYLGLEVVRNEVLIDSFEGSSWGSFIAFRMKGLEIVRLRFYLVEILLGHE